MVAKVQPGVGKSPLHDDPVSHTSSVYKSPQQVAEEVFGKVEWLNEIEGYFACPGKHRHTQPDSSRDCRIMLDGTPNVHCVHASCLGETKDASHRLRDALKAHLVRWPSEGTVKATAPRNDGGAADPQLAENAARILPWILKNLAWETAEITAQSPTTVPQDLAAQAAAYLDLYKEEDNLWIGDKFSSGSPSHKCNWQKVSEWKRMAAAVPGRLGPFVCAANFKSDVYARKEENIQDRRFFVVEFDRIDEVVDEKLKRGEQLMPEDLQRNKAKSGAVIRFLSEFMGLCLRAIVDSGNKSIHAHFDMPPESLVQELEVILTAFKADPAAFRAAQPVRMPGYMSRADGRVHRLLYLDVTKIAPCLKKTPSQLVKGIAELFIKSETSKASSATTPGGGQSTVPSSTSPSNDGNSSFSSEGGRVNAEKDSLNSSSSEDHSPKTNTSTSSTTSQAAGSSSGTTASGSSCSSNSCSQPLSPEWPAPLPAAAFHGIAGQIVRMVEPHSEADPVALLVHLLVAVGNIVGRDVFIKADGASHYLNLFTAIVGDTAKARKGTAWNQIRRLLVSVDAVWSKDCIKGGLSTGEGLIWTVRDPIFEQKKGKSTPGQTELVMKDPGIQDKRLLVMETEMARTFNGIVRDGNTLSAVLRSAWDGDDLNTMVKSDPYKSTAPHVSFIGHITKEELLHHLNATESANGFANRFLWIASRRSKYLPEGGNIDEVNFDPILMRLRSIIDFARSCGEIKRSASTRSLWEIAYRELSEGSPGLLGAITGRAEAQVMRLSAIYAMLDKSRLIEPQHHEAALAVWKYCQATVRWIFGDKTGDKIADKIHAALKCAGGAGLTLTDISTSVFNRNQSAFNIHEALKKLVEYGYAQFRSGKTDSGGTEERWFVKAKVRN